MGGWLQRLGADEKSDGWRPSLKVTLAALVALALLPTLGVVAMALLQAGRSLEDVARQQLLDTTHIIAQSATSELNATARMLASYAALRRSTTIDPNDESFLNGRLATVRIVKGSGSGAGMPLANGAPEELAVAAARTGRMAVSNLIDEDGDPVPRIALAVPYYQAADDVEVITLVVKPANLIHSARIDDSDGSMIFAVLDGTGRIIGRSIDVDKFVGKRVPDWEKRQTLAAHSGTFSGAALDGARVFFAFHAIANSPGWVAVAGEAHPVFESRWRQPLIAMITVSTVTVLLALLATMLLASRIQRPIKGLVARAHAVAAGNGDADPLTNNVPRSFVSEFDTLRQSLMKAETAQQRSLQAERTAAQTLAGSELRYRSIAQAGALAFWTTDPSGEEAQIVGLKALAGLDDGFTLVDDFFLQQVHPDDAPVLEHVWADARARQERFEIEFRVRTPQGWRWVRSHGAPAINDQGKLVEWIGVLKDITERREGEEALRIERERLALATAVSRMGIWEINIENGQVICDAQWHEISGIPSDQRVTTIEQLRNTVHPDDRHRATTERIAALRTTKQDNNFAFRIIKPNGEIRWLSSASCLIQRRGDSPERVIGVVMDITEARLAEEKLHESYEALRQAEKLALIGSWSLDVESGVLTRSDMLWEINGYERDTLSTTADLENRMSPEDFDHLMAAIDRCKTTGAPYDLEFEQRRPNGTSFVAHVRGQAFRDQTGKIVRLAGTVQDISERKDAAARLTALADNLPKGAIYRVEWHPDGRQILTYMSAGISKLIGITAEALLERGQGFWNEIDPEFRPTVRRLLDEAHATRSMAECEFRSKGPAGETVWMRIRAVPRFQADGRVIWDGTMQDITNERAAGEALQEAKARLDALADNLPKGAMYRMEWAPDGQRYLVYVSAGIAKLIGVTADELIERGNGFWDHIHPDDHQVCRAALDKAVATRSIFDAEFRSKSPSGEQVWMRFRSAPRFQPDGRIIWDGIIQDISDEKLAAETLLHAKDVAEAAERTKSDFLATMSHEIRTPMNTVIGMTRLTLQTDLTSKQRNYLEKIDGSAKTLLSLINDVLDYSKIEAGGLELEDTVFDLDGLLESVSSVTAIRAEEKDLEIAYAINPETPRRLRGDPLRLTQILTNLVGNAIKFTSAGEVVVSIGPDQEADGSPMLRFSVRDTGIGLTEEQIQGLFRPFSQAEKSTSRKYGGTGLGLAICKQLVEAMDGRIEALGLPGRGSTFTFFIPLRSADEAIQAETAARRAGGIENRRVLIVDDNASARQILRAMVQDFGMSADVVESGPEALVSLHAAVDTGQPFDIVLMDWRMPGMDGLETARQIRNDARLPFMPAVLMVTAYGREEVLRRAEQLGLQGVLIKPITESVMYNTLLDILSPVTMLTADSVLNGSGSASRALPLQSELLVQLAGKRVLVVDDNALNREVATDFLLAVAMEVTTAIDGEDALRILNLQPFDVVLMDMQMPVMDGLSATRAIRAEPQWAELPIVALTAQARVEDRKIGLEAGMTAHLTKPIDEIQMYKTLAEVLGLTSIALNGGQEPAAPVVSSDLANRPSLDLAAVLRRFGGNKERAERLLRGFLRDFHDTPQRLKHYLGIADLQEVASLAHLVKGSTGYFEQDEICVAAEWLEDAARRGDMVASVAFADILVRHFRNLLDDVRRALPDAPGKQGAVEAMDAASALRLIDQAGPLVAGGDHAAHALLERIRNGLPHDQDRMIADEVRGHFDDLDLAAAAAALERLKTNLKANHGRIE